MADENSAYYPYITLADIEIEDTNVEEEDRVSVITDDNETHENRMLEVADIIEVDSIEDTEAGNFPGVEMMNDPMAMDEDVTGTVINGPVGYGPNEQYKELNDFVDLLAGLNPEDFLWNC